MKVDAFLTQALAELGVYQAGEAPSGEDADTALFIFNEVLDALNADNRALYTVQFSAFTLTPNLSPHTIGLSTNSPAPTFSVSTGRPTRILGANLVLNTTTPNINLPLNIRDKTWWLSLSVPSLSTAIPTDLYYEPDWPNGSLYFWTVPTAAYGVQLEIETLLAQVTLTTTFTLPPGYQQALRLTTAEALQPIFQVPMPPTLPQRAMEARARCWSGNVTIPRLRTATDGLQSTGGAKTYFNYYTGMTS